MEQEATEQEAMALDESALDESALDESALDETALDETALDESALDRAEPDQAARGRLARESPGEGAASPRPEIVIRPAAGLADAAIIRDIYAPWIEQTAISFEAVVPSVEEIHARMTARPRLPWLIAEVGGEPVGYAYASRHAARAAYRWCADVAVYLKAGERGRGVGRRLYERLIPEVRALGYVSLFACISQPNPPSVGLHTALGFRPVGVHPNSGYKFGRWHAVGWYVLTPEDPPAMPAEPGEWVPPDAS